ncbi:hypothetical protein M2459_001118 [Parabacteroides sp. PF5-5]|uniref:hypothetical protein n=1 Tax=unclassified Parabacteroides TaxID=2649774 RepID=UPI002475C26C|nr:MULTISPECIES: hypothetical protein [unclassified Parabacteroides]MDH6304385.1 hypothetical protein [Parabacteroides sp. PH5-39]MDH6315462.1 hypothetical protein [Parabacteroides sp. PF5-13]MDH6319044.1 hypothetical protein [Parabacteroides sp. PH5-13]MDH6322774.1 hypothetical protein [Parabacteroides sp. PH5-8]MDH6326654.1 hypothetical protein [Parabacteroides sp. PH5-41]
MKKVRLDLVTLVVTIIMLLSAVACSEDRDPGFQEKTPITLGKLSIEAADTDTRATVDEFFLDRNVLTLHAVNKSSGVEDFTIPYIFSKPDATKPGKWETTDKILYLENVYSNGSITHDLSFSFGQFSPDQQTDLIFHQADTLHGVATLDISTLSAPVFNPTTLQRKGVKVVMNITRGDGWISDAAFLAAMGNYQGAFWAKTGGILANQPVSTQPTYQVILPLNELPDNGGYIFSLMPIGGGSSINCRYTLDQGSSVAEGKSLVITAALNNTNNGTLSPPSITVDAWDWNGSSIDLPANPNTPLAQFLQWSEDVRTDQSLDFTLSSDIDLTGINFKPLNIAYTGTFDGGGHTITGLTIRGDYQFAALFKINNSGTIKNLTLQDANIHSTHTDDYLSIAALVGVNSGLIENCHVRNSSITHAHHSTNGNAGTIATHSNGTIIACTAQACTLKAGAITGGITGRNDSSMIACHVEGGSIESALATTNNNSMTGGISGSGNNIIACYAAPDAITPYAAATSQYRGGITGTGVNLTANYWKSPIPGVIFGSGGSYTNINAEPITTLTNTEVDAMNDAIDAYNSDPANVPCNYLWTTGGITRK